MKKSMKKSKSQKRHCANCGSEKHDARRCPQPKYLPPYVVDTIHVDPKKGKDTNDGTEKFPVKTAAEAAKRAQARAAEAAQKAEEQAAQDAKRRAESEQRAKQIEEERKKKEEERAEREKKRKAIEEKIRLVATEVAVLTRAELDAMHLLQEACIDLTVMASSENRKKAMVANNALLDVRLAKTMRQIEQEELEEDLKKVGSMDLSSWLWPVLAGGLGAYWLGHLFSKKKDGSPSLFEQAAALPKNLDGSP